MFDWIASILEGSGALGIAALMFLENIFPPIPSELIMPLAGFNAARGGTSLLVAILAGALGSLAGAWVWYLLGKAFGRQRLHRLIARHGRWLAVTPAELERAETWFARHGRATVFFGRLVPTIRTLISIPAGIAHMLMPRFILYSSLGSLLWCGFLTVAGYWLEDSYEHVSAWVNPVSTLVVLALVGLYVWRVIVWDPKTEDS